MEENHDGLWNGGSWEQPSATYMPPPAFPVPQPQPSVLRPRRQKRRRRLPWYGWLFLALFLFGVVATGLQWYWYGAPWANSDGSYGQEDDYEFQNKEDYSRQPPTIPAAPTGLGVELALVPAGREALSFTQIYDKNLPSIVSIDALSHNSRSTGTGIVLTPDGYLVTNAHVVAEAQLVQVILHDNRVLEAALVGFDPDEDLAVLKVEAQGLTPAQFGDSNLLRQGDRVAALGDSLGYRSTITDGIVSALDREVDMDGHGMALIQTSAAINPGNSGGALLNEYGQVVGITTIKIVSKDGSAEGMGFAIPSRRVKYVADLLLAGETVRPGVFGITVDRYPASGGGLRVVDVAMNSDASAKGIRPGDVLLEVDGVPVLGTEDLARRKLDRGAGDLVTLTVRRDSAIFTVEIALMSPAS